MAKRQELTHENVKQRLIEGKTYKNWKQICDILSISDMRGNTKVGYMTDLNQYCKFSTKKEDVSLGNKIRIDEIYSQAIPKDDNRGKNSSPIQPSLQNLILDMLANCNVAHTQKINDSSELLQISTGKLLENLAMVNKDYRECRNMIPELSKYLEIDEWYISEFYQSVHVNFKGKLETAMRQLSNRALLIWHSIIMVCEMQVRAEINENGTLKIDNNGNVVTVKDTVYRKANEKEEAIIRDCERKALITINKEGKQDVFLSGLWSEYQKIVSKMVFKRTNINYYYKAYEFNFNRESIIEYLSKEIDNHIATKILINSIPNATNDVKNIVWKDSNMREAQGHAVDSLEESVKNRHEKAKERILLLGGSSEKHSLNMKIDKTFIDSNKILREELILPKSDDDLLHGVI